jgi:hypothetical protein
MPQFFVCFTGDAKHHRDDMIKIAKGAKGVYYTELDRAVYDAKKENCPVFLVVGFVFLLYVLWGPILEAGRRNALLRRYPAAAIFEGVVADQFRREVVENRREQANRQGRLELVENRRTWLCLELEDEDGYLGQIRFPLEKKHEQIRPGMVIRCLVLSERKDFSRIGALSDGWLPQLKQWVGEYPYLLRPAFEELCLRRLG